MPLTPSLWPKPGPVVSRSLRPTVDEGPRTVILPVEEPLLGTESGYNWLLDWIKWSYDRYYPMGVDPHVGHC